MRRVIFFVIMSFMLCIVCPSYGRTIKIYVSNKGDDKNSGSYWKPLSSINEAVKRAKEIIDAFKGDSIVIRVVGGLYQISETIEILPYMNDNASITIKGDGIEKTILSGGVELPPFEEDKNTGLWYVPLDLELANNLLNQLFVNGRRAIWARTPNCDKYFAPLRADENEVIDSSNLYKQTIFLPSEAQKFISNLKASDDIYVSILHYWDFTRKKAEVFNYNDNNVSITGPSVKRWNYFKNATQLFLENDVSFLDEPGEFYYDRYNKIIYYYPRPEDLLQETRAIVPLTESILNLKGDDENVVRNITIKDLTIANTLYNLSVDGENPQQAVASKGASVMLDYSENIVFSNCEFCHIGLYGIWFREACIGCKIENSYIHDLGAGGVKIGENKYMYSATPSLTRNIIVNNNIICEGGRVLPPAVGVILFNASDCQITHNDIFDFYYTGVSVGWSWGFDGSPSKRNIVSYNHVHHLGWNGLSDMGGIYTLGLSEGTEITNNIIHDVYTFGPDGYGIYLDEGTSGVLVKNNIVYSCKSAGFAQHYGRNNIIVNNIFANNRNAQISIGNNEQNKNSLLFSANIVFTKEKNKIFANPQWGKYDNVKADNNLYWSGGVNDFFCGLDQDGWIIKTGKDKHSVVKDPSLIIDGDKDVRLNNKIVINEVFFETIKTKKVGVQGKLRRKIAMQVERKTEFKQLELTDKVR